MPKIKVLIFDVDLTICNNSERERRSIERTLDHRISDGDWALIKDEYGFHRTLEVLKINSSLEKIVNGVMKHFLYDEDLFELDYPLDMAVKTLNILNNDHIIYYLTGRPIHHTAVDFIKKFGFPDGKVFSIKLGFGESHKKIRPLSQILREAKVNPEEAVSVADLPGDAMAAKSVGVVTVGTYQAHLNMKEELQRVCDHVIGNILELPTVLNEL